MDACPICGAKPKVSTHRDLCVELTEVVTHHRLRCHCTITDWHDNLNDAYIEWTNATIPAGDSGSAITGAAQPQGPSVAGVSSVLGDSAGRLGVVL